MAVSAVGAALGCGGGGGGGGGGSTLPPAAVDGVCGMTVNACAEGTLLDSADSSTDYRWQCRGSNGGGTADCSLSKYLDTPDPPNLDDLRREYSQTPEFQYQPALSLVKADYAYARGATGEGVTVGVIDSGVDFGHPEFSGPDKLTVRNVPGYAPMPTCSVSVRDCDVFHGTWVSGILAANRDAGPSADLNMHGVAFDARLLVLGIPLGSSPPSYRPVDLSDPESWAEFDAFFSGLYAELNPQVAAANLSFGVSGGIERYSEAELRAAFPSTIQTMAQADLPAADRTIYVWAAGNARDVPHADGTPEPAESVEISSGFPYRIPELRGHWLAVAALNTDSGEIAEFSNRCGVAKSFCLAAPGTLIRGPYPSESPDSDGVRYVRTSGTSGAAPIVTGGVALLTQRFRGQLGADEIVARLLATANKTGIYADSDVYGQGLLDLDAATRPRMRTQILTGASFDGPAAAEDLSSLAGGPAFGDALARGLAGRELAAFDQLDAPFFRPLGGYLRQPGAARARVEDRLRSLGSDPRGGLAWNRPGAPELRARFERVPLGYRESGDRRLRRSLASPDAAEDRLGALSLSAPLGRGTAFLGMRGHPGWSFGLHAAGVVEPGAFSDSRAFASPFLSLARDGGVAGLELPLAGGALRAAAFRGAAQWGEWRNPDRSRAAGALMEYRFRDSSGAGAVPKGLAFQAGWLRESERLMGSRPRGAFGALRGRTGFAGASAHWSLGPRWSAFAAAHAGWSRPEISDQGLLRDVSSLWTSSFGLGIAGRGLLHRGDRLSLRLSQPLRVESGRAKLVWAAGRTRDRQLRLERAALALEPSGRQLDLELSYARPWARGSAHFAALAIRNPDHTRQAPEFALLFRFGRSF